MCLLLFQAPCFRLVFGSFSGDVGSLVLLSQTACFDPGWLRLDEPIKNISGSLTICESDAPTTSSIKMICNIRHVADSGESCAASTKLTKWREMEGVRGVKVPFLLALKTRQMRKRKKEKKTACPGEGLVG